MGVRSWQIFYREIDHNGNITFRGTRPLAVLTKENQARNKFGALEKNASVNQAYEMVQVSPTGEIEYTESTLDK